MQSNTSCSEPSSMPASRTYEAPKVMVMDEKEVLKVFQITSASISWWG